MNNSYEEAVTIEKKIIRVNPRKYLSCIEADFIKYIEGLRNDKNNPLRQRFQDLWDEVWKKAKESGYQDAQI